MLYVKKIAKIKQYNYLYSHFEEKIKQYKSRDFLPISFLLSENAEQNSSTISCIKTTSLGKLLRMQELPFQGAQCFPCIMQ